MAMTGQHVAYWDAQAASYDRVTAWAERRLLADARAWVGERAHGRTLDVGVGTGANLPHLVGHADSLCGVDQSGAMLDLARRRAGTLGADVELVQGDAAALPWPDASFDTVVCTFALCCVDDELAVLRELARVVRPDGAVLLADHVESSSGVLRAGQSLLDAVERRHGERFRRRPLLRLPEAGLAAIEQEASRYRLVERVAARRERRARRH